MLTLFETDKAETKPKRSRRRLPKAEVRVISFSGGRSSGMMLRVMQENGEIRPTDVIAFANTGKEHPATLDFVRDCGVIWGLPIVWLEWTPTKPHFKVVDYETAAREGEPFIGLVTKRVYLPNATQRLCTGDMKVKTIRRYIRSLGHRGDFDTFLGLRHDEPERVSKKKAANNVAPAKRKEPEWYEMPLNDLKVRKTDVRAFWDAQPLTLPSRTGWGIAICVL